MCDALALQTSGAAQTLARDASDQQGSTIGRQSGTFMPVHPGLLEGGLVRTSSLQDPPRVNNLLGDHNERICLLTNWQRLSNRDQ